MPQTDLGKTTISTSTIEDYEVAAMQTDAATGQKETEWQNTKWVNWLGYYKQIPELKKAIDAYATWAVGRGVTADARTTIILDHITGWGEDTFNSILWNMVVCKKIAGDAYCEIIRNEETGTLINLKPLAPDTLKHIVNPEGIIIRYEQTTKLGDKKTIRKFQPNQILHLCNDRVADEIHGTSVVEACQWVIDARNESMSDWKRISHRSTIRVLYIDMDDTTKLKVVRDQYAEAIKKGELMIIPAKRTEAEFGEINLPPVDAFLRWIEYLENFFYQAVGVPKIATSTAGLSEAGAKIGLVTFDPWYVREQTELKADIWNQLALRVEFEKQPSLMDQMSQTEAKNTGQTGFQPKETKATMERE